MIPPKPPSRSALSSHTSMSRRARSATSAACSASHAGVFTLDGTSARVRESQPAPATASAFSSTSLRDSGSTRPASTTWPTGCSSGPSERQWNSYEPSTSPSTTARIAASSPREHSEVATDCRPLARRASDAAARRRSSVVPEPTPTSSTSRRSELVSPAVLSTTRSTTSPTLPVAWEASSSANRSSSSSSSSSAAPGPSVGPLSSASTGSATTSAPGTAEGGAPLRETCGGDTWAGSTPAPYRAPARGHQACEDPDRSAVGVSPKSCFAVSPRPGGGLRRGLRPRPC